MTVQKFLQLRTIFASMRDAAPDVDQSYERLAHAARAFHTRGPMIFFSILFVIDILAALVALGFFVWGLIDGSVSDFNIGEWLLLLGGIGAVLGGGWWLRAAGRHRQAYGLLLILAIPCIIAAVFLLAVLILQPRWN